MGVAEKRSNGCANLTNRSVAGLSKRVTPIRRPYGYTGFIWDRVNDDDPTASSGPVTTGLLGAGTGPAQAMAWLEGILIQVVAPYADFNHVPGGANILYMDGHATFVKYPSDSAPVQASFAAFDQMVNEGA